MENTGVVSLDYEWNIEVIDRQTAMDAMATLPTAVGPVLVSPPIVVPSTPPGKMATDVAPGKTTAAGESL